MYDYIGCCVRHYRLRVWLIVLKKENLLDISKLKNPNITSKIIPKHNES